MPAPSNVALTTMVPFTNGVSAKVHGEPALLPMEVYKGSYDGGKGIALRIGNGGAGQSGLIRSLANAFIDYEVRVRGYDPFSVECLVLFDVPADLGVQRSRGIWAIRRRLSNTLNSDKSISPSRTTKPPKINPSKMGSQWSEFMASEITSC